jgi:hypothetical protein
VACPVPAASTNHVALSIQDVHPKPFNQPVRLPKRISNMLDHIHSLADPCSVDNALKHLLRHSNPVSESHSILKHHR